VPDATRGINPLNWTTAETYADKSLNKGAVFTDYDGNIIKQGADFTGTYLYRLYMANGVNCKLILYRSFSKC